jgi:hypothetical protein
MVFSWSCLVISHNPCHSDSTALPANSKSSGIRWLLVCSTSGPDLAVGGIPELRCHPVFGAGLQTAPLNMELHSRPKCDKNETKLEWCAQGVAKAPRIVARRGMSLQKRP